MQLQDLGTSVMGKKVTMKWLSIALSATVKPLIRTRKFFFSFIEQLIANICRLESNLQLLGREEKSKLKGLKGGTGSYHVETAEESCILKSCGKVHIHPKFKRATKSLQFCPFFTSLKPAERRKTFTAEKLCTRCLTSGHRHKDCKSSVVCKNCASDSHHILLCKLLEGGKGKDGGDKKFKKKKDNEKAADHKKSSAHKIDASEDEAETSAGEGEGVEDPLTITHFGNFFELSSADSYFLQKSAKVDRSLTMVSTVMIKNGKHDYESQAMWDNWSERSACTSGWLCTRWWRT
jgi:hypothetical protein